MTQKLFGLIGYPLSHSFSKKYFAQKFEKEGISNCQYENFPLKTIAEFPDLLKQQAHLVGLNVTIPYKQLVIPFLDQLDESARAVGAVNTIKIQNRQLIGYNTDVYGFEQSLKIILEQKYAPSETLNALILGTGGAAKAVAFILKKLGIIFKYVSRTPKANQLAYTQLKTLEHYPIIINTTPLGMSPNIHTLPKLPYHTLSDQHLLYDLVYNPVVTAFLQQGLERGASIKNGLEMLHLQAEKAWEIWNEM